MAAEDARALARRLELFKYVVWPVLRVPLRETGEFSVGSEFSARLWFFQVIPGWTHHLKIVTDDELELYTNERSGPARIWNHRLTFVPTGKSSCRYTDEIEVEGGLLGVGTAAFIRIFFAYRQWRWRRLARIVG